MCVNWNELQYLASATTKLQPVATAAIRSAVAPHYVIVINAIAIYIVVTLHCLQVVDLPADHPSCSKQHAVLQYRLVEHQKADGTGKSSRLLGT